MVASAEGGVNIEDVAASNPEAILKFAIDKQYIKKSTIPNLTEFTVSGGNSRSRDEVYMYKYIKSQPK